VVVAPKSLAQVAARVEARLRVLLEAEAQRWSQLDQDLAQPFGELSRLVLSGGKRLRPAFCFWGFVGAGGDPLDEHVIDAGAAFELMHACALFHDDVMDGSLTRRGAPTTHEAYGAQHIAQKLAGESRRFGEGAAILIGDLSFVYSDQLLAGASPQVWRIWNELRIELNIGQYLDLLGSANSERSIAKAERICRYKSGKYTVERPLQLGAMLAVPQSQPGAPLQDGATQRTAELLAALSQIGLPLGDAFQMRDDVLGALGESVVTGKPVGDDLREGKPTPLMAIATANASVAQLKVLQLVGAARLTDAQVADVQQVLVDTGAVTQLEARIRSNTDAALGAIAAAPITQEARDALTELAHFVSWRNN